MMNGSVMSVFLRSLMVASVLVLGAGAARADLIVNGSFENPNVGTGFTVFTNGGVPGWTSNNNEIEINNTAGSIGFAAYSGAQSAELNGTTYDTISQTVTGLVVGKDYLLTWAYSGRVGAGNQQTNVLFNGVQVGQNTSTGAAAGWVNTSVIVRAAATSQVLSFAAINVGGSASAGNELDAVTLNAYVPEPATIALFGAGLLGLAAWRRPRRMPSAALG